MPPIALWVEPTVPDGWPADGLGPLGALTAQLPAAESLPRGSWVGVRAGRGVERGWLARLRGGRRAEVHLALRCTALLALGYEAVGAGEEPQGGRVAWGRVPLGG